MNPLMTLLPYVGIALLAGVVPSLIWLFFWLLEDRCQPEPKSRIILTFALGMAAVWAVLPLEQALGHSLSGFALILTWAFLEEAGKLIAAGVFGLGSSAYDEPLDAVVYLVTAALGFAAMENALFVFTPVVQGNILHLLSLGDIRFIGATLLHTLSSATVGIAMALAYFRSPRVRAAALIGGVILATALHALFNFFILEGSGNGAVGTSIYIFIWVALVAVLFLVERVKHPVRDYC